MINYSIAVRAVNTNLLEINQAKARIKAAKVAGVEPQESDVTLAKTPLVTKAYGVAQYTEVMTIEKFAKHISDHGCVYSHADISAILYMAVDCMRENLLDGKKIRLGGLGDFSISLVSKGAETAEKFNAGVHITGINVIWDCGQQFKNLIANAEFNLVASRAAQAAVLKAVKAGETVVDLSKDSSDDDDPNGGGGGESQDSGNTGSQNSSNSGNSQTPDSTQKYTLTLQSNDSNMGSVTGGGQYAQGAQASIKAQPKSGYLFDQWSDGNRNAERSVTVTRNQTLIATFYQQGTTRPSEEEDELPPAE